MSDLCHTCLKTALPTTSASLQTHDTMLTLLYDAKMPKISLSSQSEAQYNLTGPSPKHAAITDQNVIMTQAGYACSVLAK